jgi:hypothetical protein
VPHVRRSWRLDCEREHACGNHSADRSRAHDDRCDSERVERDAQFAARMSRVVRISELLRGMRGAIGLASIVRDHAATAKCSNQ